MSDNDSQIGRAEALDDKPMTLVDAIISGATITHVNPKPGKDGMSHMLTTLGDLFQKQSDTYAQKFIQMRVGGCHEEADALVGLALTYHRAALGLAEMSEWRWDEQATALSTLFSGEAFESVAAYARRKRERREKVKDEESGSTVAEDPLNGRD